MKITRLDLGTLRVPLRAPFKTAVRTVDAVETVVVRIRTDTGHTGFGEAPATAAITVLPPALTLSKTVNTSPVPYNTAATFTVTITNNSVAALPSSFSINDAVPSGLTAMVWICWST